VRNRERGRRLTALEAKAAERAAAEGGLDWSLFDTAQLTALLEMVDSFEAGEIGEAGADERLAAVPGMAEAFERALAERDQRRAWR
jgi:hypothetical protein